MERRWQLKQISAAVWILATEGERGTLYQPLHLFSLSLFGSLHHLHFHVSFPLLFSPPPPSIPLFFLFSICFGLGEHRDCWPPGSPVQRRCEPSNRLSLPTGTSHTNTQLKGVMSSMLASINHYHINSDTLG